MTLTSLVRSNRQAFAKPEVNLHGAVDHAMYNNFRAQIGAAQTTNSLLVIELSTLGGDPEVARMMGEDIRFLSELYPERRIVFLGKAAVYSAGATLMSFFARENRFVTRGTRLMIHERAMSKTIQLSGPLTSCLSSVRAALNELEQSIRIQNEGFANLVLGSNVDYEDLRAKATNNWYLEAEEARGLGLIEDIL